MLLPEVREGEAQTGGCRGLEENGDNGVCEAEMRSKWAWGGRKEEVKRYEGS